MRLSVIRGFTLIEIMVATLMLALFFLFYLEWMTTRTTQSRHLAMLSQFEHVRQATLAYADHARLGLLVDQKTLEQSISGWPADDTDSSGIQKLFNAGHLAPTFASVFPGSRWLLIEQTNGNEASWLKVRYETPADYGLGEDLRRTQQALQHWSTYIDGTPCQSQQLSGKKCDAIELYMLSGPAPLPLTTTVYSLRRYLLNSARKHNIGGLQVNAVDMKGASMHRWRRLIVGGRPGTPYKFSSGLPYFYEKQAERTGKKYQALLGRRYLDEDGKPRAKLKQLESLPDTLNLDGFEDEVAEWNRMRGETYTYEQAQAAPASAILVGAYSFYPQEGMPYEVTDGPTFGDMSGELPYFVRALGLYADRLHLGGTWTASLESSGSIREMPTGTSFLPFLWAGRDAPRWNAWWYAPETSTFRNLAGGLRYGQPFYNKTSQVFEKTPSRLEREITAVNIGLAAFNKAIMGDYGIYTSNLSIGERSLVVDSPTTASLLSYFTEFRFKTVKIFQKHNVSYTARGAGTKYDLYQGSTQLYGTEREIDDKLEYQQATTSDAEDIQWAVYRDEDDDGVRELIYQYNQTTTWDFPEAQGRDLDTTMNCENTQKGLIDRDVLNFIATRCTDFGFMLYKGYEVESTGLYHVDNQQFHGSVSGSGSSGLGNPEQSAPDRWHPGHQPSSQQPYRPAPEIGLMSGLLRRSDARLKRNIRPLSVRHEALTGINAYSYQNLAGTENSPRHLGFVAQEVNNHYPELVKQDEQGHLSVSYDGMVPVLWGHLQAAVEDNAGHTRTLEEKLSLLEEQMKQQRETSEN